LLNGIIAKVLWNGNKSEKTKAIRISRQSASVEIMIDQGIRDI
jgi:hypothetical protein